jgi:RNA polymerase sigma factor for flagellar operon FliA
MEESAREDMSPAARDLVQRNFALVEHIVSRVLMRFPRGADRDELAQVAMLGLIEAARRFDPDRGIAFSTFAGPRIEGSILDAVRQMSWAPRSVRANQREIDAAEARLRARLRRNATEVELAGELGLDVDQLAMRRALVAKGAVVSLDEGLSTSIGDTIADTRPSTEDVVERREMHARIRACLSLLSDRHRYVVVGHLLEDRPMHDLARDLGVTRSRVSQLKSEAIDMLRIAMELPRVAS